MNRKLQKLLLGLMLSAILTMGMAGAAFASTKSYDWYLYYNDSQNKVELCDWKFEQYSVCTYTATPYTSGNPTIFSD